MTRVLFIGAENTLTQSVIKQFHMRHPEIDLRLLTRHPHQVPIGFRRQFEVLVGEPTDVLTMAQATNDTQQIYISDALNAARWLRALVWVTHHFTRNIQRIFVSTLAISAEVARVTQIHADYFDTFNTLRKDNLKFSYIHELRPQCSNGRLIEIFNTHSEISRQVVGSMKLPEFLSNQVAGELFAMGLAN
ncbi:hypothetical protein [Furfurilactobacillus siliginis]|uniref:NAD(P)-binding domain-containing protein n=1 Tax=Furfurilactobacillus siliginis TaxID=348151 RepID=A0A0R2L0B6_9LACO|nr:hypothetical protein [Furfurilactobacillus siliginis]KRN94896.1 hypothetical protein IV55_GL000439 [Furfurilactobacillus siliginis]GEK28473.1 hypothetical protein LSI01_07840 [Furfurilactobacillus siliginis]